MKKRHTVTQQLDHGQHTHPHLLLFLGGKRGLVWTGKSVPQFQLQCRGHCDVHSIEWTSAGKKRREKTRSEERTCIFYSRGAGQKGSEERWAEAAAGHYIDSWQILFAFPQSLKQPRQNILFVARMEKWPNLHRGFIKKSENGFIFSAMSVYHV